MKVIKHKFRKHSINSETKILIIGTFNPDVSNNEADFFYGRKRNYLWQLLPETLNQKSLKYEKKQKKLEFMKENNIDFAASMIENNVFKTITRNTAHFTRIKRIRVITYQASKNNKTY